MVGLRSMGVLFGFAVWSTTARAEPSLTPGHYECETGSYMDVVAGAGGELMVGLTAMGGPPDFETGDITGRLQLNGNAGRLLGAECKIVVRIVGDGKLAVAQQSSPMDCGFGMGVMADGVYTLKRTAGSARSAPPPVAAVSTSAPVAGSKPVAASPAAAPPGNLRKVDGNYRSDLNGLFVQVLDDHTLRVAMSLRDSRDHEGELDGRAVLRGSNAVYRSTEFGLCEIHFDLSQPDTITVRQTKDECGFGYGVVADGSYRRHVARKAQRKSTQAAQPPRAAPRRRGGR
jgi:hypothetical protein